MRALTLGLVLSSALLGCQKEAAKPAAPPPPAAPPVAVKQPRQVMGQEARAAVASGATLLDVRTVDEFQELHLEGAKNVPLHELAGALASLPKDKPVVVYCAVGSRSATAAMILSRAGYDVLNLGAMGNWNQ
jgi:phage shock protein E